MCERAERSFDRYERERDFRDRYLPHPKFSQPIKFLSRFEEDWQRAHQERIEKQRFQQEQLERQRLHHQRLQHQRFIRQNQRIEERIQKKLLRHREDELKREIKFNEEQERSKKQLQEQHRLQKQQFYYRQLPSAGAHRRKLPLPASKQKLPLADFPHPLEQIGPIGVKHKTHKDPQQYIPHSQLSQLIYPVPVHQPSPPTNFKHEFLKQQLDVIQQQQQIQQQQINTQFEQQHHLQKHQFLQEEKLHRHRLKQQRIQEEHLRRQRLHKEHLQNQRVQQHHLQKQRLRQQKERLFENAHKGQQLGDKSYVFRGTSVHPGVQPAIQPSIQPVIQPGIQPAIQPAIQPGTQGQPTPGFLSQVQAAISKRIKNPSPITLPRFASSSFSPRNVFPNLPQVHTKIPSVHTFGASKDTGSKFVKPISEFPVHPIPPVVVAPSSCRIPEGKSPKKGTSADKRGRIEHHRHVDPSTGAIPKVKDPKRERSSCLPSSCDPRGGDHLLNQLKESVNLDVSHLVHDLWSAIQNLTDSISMVRVLMMLSFT